MPQADHSEPNEPGRPSWSAGKVANPLQQSKAKEVQISGSLGESCLSWGEAVVVRETYVNAWQCVRLKARRLKV